MTLYTIVPETFIYPHEHERTASMTEMMIDGVRVVVEYEGGSHFRIDRIVSTNPADFMHSDVQPGGVVNVFQQLKS